jgi:hypothetical protein
MERGGGEREETPSVAAVAVDAAVDAGLPAPIALTIHSLPLPHTASQATKNVEAKIAKKGAEAKLVKKMASFEYNHGVGGA